MTLRFDEPSWLWLMLIALPIAASWWWLDRLPPLRRFIAVALRVAALLCVVTALARPQLLSTQSTMAVVGVLDVSGSVDRFSQTPPRDLAAAFLTAAERRGSDDRVGLVVFDGRASAVIVPTSLPRSMDGLDVAVEEGSALSDAVALARALIPAGEAGRVIVLSDGLETIGSAADVARTEPAGRVAIDTVLLPLRDVLDVSIDGFDLPATALPRSVVTALVSLRATAPTTGTLRLLMDGRSMVLSGSGAEGDGVRLSLAAGATVVRVQIPIGDGPVHQLDAIFESADPALDQIPENSIARRVIAVPAGRSVLILSVSGKRSAADRMLEDAGFDVRRLPADALPEDPLWLAGFDLVVLDNVPAALLSRSAQQLLADQVQRLGGGLLCTGGPDSFGPGGWRGSIVAELLPVEIEPPTELRRPQSAVVFVIDRSGSMRQSVAGARASQQEIANEAAALAIESIASRAYVGVVAFENMPSMVSPLVPLDDPATVAARVRDISPDGGTAIGAALEMALDALDGVRDVDQRIVVLLTDGRGRDDDLLSAQAERATKAKVRVTTIAIGDSADDLLLQRIAEGTGGVFHPVRNPRVLPRVLIESVQSVNRPLVREGIIGVVPSGDSDLARALRGAPSLAGVVVLGRARSEEATIDGRTELDEPLLARWPAGIGRVALFASEFAGPWSSAWEEWERVASFWESVARWCARAPGSAPIAAEARIDDGRFVVLLEAAAADAIDGAVVDGIARSPDGTRVPFSLRRVAPRRFVGSVDARASGPWLAVLSPRGASGALPPILAAAVAPEGVEYARHRADPAALEILRRATGGREIALDALPSADLFVRDGLTLGSLERSLAPLLLLIGAFAFLVDTATRRLAVRRRMITDAVTITSADSTVAGAIGSRRRTAPASRSAHANVPTTVGIATATASASASPLPTESTSGSSRSIRSPGAVAAPSPEEVRAALAALRRGQSAPIASETSSTKAPPEGDPEGTTEESSSSAATVEALRRARERSRIFPP